MNRILIHGEAVGATPQRVTYNTWARHYNACEICNQQYDHVNPGAPQVRDTAPPDERFLWTKKRINVHGTEADYWVSWQPDTSVLCDKGRAMFDQWVLANLLTSRPLRCG